MKTLIVTLGNSEIQIDSNELHNFSIISSEGKNLLTHATLPELPIYQNRRPGKSNYYIVANARQSGETIVEHIDDYMPALKFPITDPLIEFVAQEEIDHIIWVVTDQCNVQYSNGDTLHYATILQEHFQQSIDGIEYSTIKVQNNLTDIDKQYDFWNSQLSSVFADENPVDRYYLFAQGGIDQINHALTLQLLYRFRDRVKIYQNAENQEISNLQFPHKFLADLNREKILKHLEDYDFRRALELWPTGDEEAIKLLHELSGRLELLHDTIDDLEVYGQEFLEMSDIERNRLKLQDLYVSFRIDIIQKKYNSALTKLFTIFENIFKQWVDEWSTCNTSRYYKSKVKFGQENKEWENFILDFIGSDGLCFVRNGYGGTLDMSNPSSASYFYIVRYYVPHSDVDFSEDEVKNLFKILDKMRNKRNKINHELGAASKNDYLGTLNSAKTTENEFYELLNKITLQDDLGDYEKARNQLLSRMLK